VNQLRNLLGMFWHPSVVFGRLRDRPRAVLVVFVIIAALLAAHWAAHQRVDVQAMQRQVAAEEGADSKGTQVSNQEVIDQAQRGLNIKRILGYPAIALALPLALLIFSLFFFLLLATWRRGVGFGQVFRLMAHAWLPIALRQILALPVIFTYPSIHPDKMQGLFKTDLAALTGLKLPLAGLVEPFAVWAGVLMYMAARGMGRGRIWSALVCVLLAVALAAVTKVL